MGLTFNTIDTTSAATAQADIDAAITASDANLALVRMADGSSKVVSAASVQGTDVVLDVAKCGSSSSTNIIAKADTAPGKYDTENYVPGTYGGQKTDGTFKTTVPVIGTSRIVVSTLSDLNDVASL